MNSLWLWLKPRSTVWRTTLVLGIVVLISQTLSLAFYSVNLYAPEVKQHARLSGTVLRLLRDEERKTPLRKGDTPREQWLKTEFGMVVVRDPQQFPRVMDKPLADLFTDYYARQLSHQLHETVRVFFVFKPIPVLWIAVPSLVGVWVREPLTYFADYNPFVIIAWGLGVPLLTLLAIVVLVRQLNRPLQRLEQAALRVARGEQGIRLDTRHGPKEIKAVNRAFNRMTRQLLQASRDRSFMLAGISHDLRTPLTRLRLTAEMLRDRDLAEGMVLDIRDMDEILEQFLAFMRDGSDESAESVDLNGLLREVVAQFCHLMPVQWQEQPLPVLAVRRLSVKRLLSNLFTNALRYGAPPLEIISLVHPQWLEIQIRDHGTGVNEDELPRLLRPFQRGDSARSVPGSGLGLAIVQRIVKLHHGQLTLSNHPEGGLWVRVHFPRTEVVDPASGSKNTLPGHRLAKGSR